MSQGINNEKSNGDPDIQFSQDQNRFRVYPKIMVGNETRARFEAPTKLLHAQSVK